LGDCRKSSDEPACFNLRGNAPIGELSGLPHGCERIEDWYDGSAAFDGEGRSDLNSPPAVISAPNARSCASRFHFDKTSAVNFFGQGADLLETRGWDDLAGGVIVVWYSASSSFLTTAIWRSSNSVKRKPRSARRRGWILRRVGRIDVGAQASKLPRRKET
jgi:hypothetical protein